VAPRAELSQSQNINHLERLTALKAYSGAKGPPHAVTNNPTTFIPTTDIMAMVDDYLNDHPNATPEDGGPKSETRHAMRCQRVDAIRRR
jgi:hypothetical protein